MSDAPFDPGLQPERTLLAWQRTCLAMAVGGLLIVRFATDRLGLVAVVAGLMGVLLAAAAYLASAHRYRQAHRHLIDGRPLPSSGVAVTLAAATITVFALACIAWLVVTAL